MKIKRGDSYDKRTLEIPEWFDNTNMNMIETSKSAFLTQGHAHCSLSLASFSIRVTSPTFRANNLVLVEPEGRIDLAHRVTGKLSSALTSSWDSSPKRLLVSGLTGCTSVVIVGRAGMWMSHFFEEPSYRGPGAVFKSQVIGATRDGDGPNMLSPFGLQGSGQILAAGTNVKIFVSTPKNPDTGELLYRGRVRELADLSGLCEANARATRKSKGNGKNGKNGKHDPRQDPRPI